MAALTTREARAAVASVDWDQVPGDPDDVRVVREALTHLVGDDRDPMGLEDAFSDLLDAATYVLEIDEAGAAPLVGLFLDLATCAALFDEPERLVWHAATALHRLPDHAPDGPLARVIGEREDRLRWLWDEGPAHARASVAVLVGMARLEPWRERLRERLRSSGDSALRAMIVLALVELGGEDLEALGRTLAQQAGDDWRLQRAAAVCLRLAAHQDPTLRERLEPALADHADRHGHPGWIAKLYEDAYPLEMPAALAEAEALTRVADYEPAVVLFASDSMVLVKHETRGNFTLRLAGTGLSKGDRVELAGFTPPPHSSVRKLRYRGPSGVVEIDL